jgi:lysyl endopeptidase
MKGLLTMLFICFALIISAQIEREGEPLTWQIGLDHTTGSIWRELPAILFDALLAEDQAEVLDKTKPLRFAKRINTSINFANSGRWTNLHNGDRIWMCGIEIDQAFALSFSFSQLQMPEGAMMYFYNADQTDFIGPLSQSHNTDDQPFITPPISGRRIVIEYYEPQAFRGTGSFEIEAVAASYRDMKDVAIVQEVNCFELLNYTVNNTAQMNASSAVLLTVVDDGQRVATSVLLNNTSSNGIPYLMTAQSALLGAPSRWLFLFDIAGAGCLNDNVFCWNKAVCGGVIKESNPTSGLALVRLKEMPRQAWSPYYSGWQANALNDSHRLFLIQQAFGLPQSVAEFSGEMTMTTWNSMEVGAIDHWNDGGTFIGSIGSPLFDEDLNLVGIFVGGEGSCDGGGSDYFALLADSWDEIKEYLDPFVTGQNRFDGEFPILESNDANQVVINPFVVFPNPAQDWVYVRNKTNEPITRIEINDGSGRLVSSFLPLTPSLDTSTLTEGVYFLTIYTAQAKFVHRLLIR